MVTGAPAETARTVVVTGAAAAIAWSVATGAGLAGPVMAAISATFSVQLSVHASVKEGVQRLVATLIGVVVALVMWKTAGVRTWSIAAIVVASLVLGRLLRLGDGVIMMPATSLGVLVIGSTITDVVVLERMAATAVGVVVGASLSPFAGGLSPLERAQRRLVVLSSALADLLTQLGEGTRRPYTAEEAGQWLSTARNLDYGVEEAAKAVKDLSGRPRWPSRTPASAIRPMRSSLRDLWHSVDHVNSIARSLFDAVNDPNSHQVPAQIGPVLTAAADAFAVHTAVLADGDPAHLTDALEALREARVETVRALRAHDAGTWLVAGSILTDVRRITETLNRQGPAMAIGAWDISRVPAVSEIVPAKKALPGSGRRHNVRRLKL
ncbi:hypothetical protein GCM10012284_32450 [Mangrovihabitans endophyticus]|uniref:Aromatic acid exporter family member 1 n=1 Tax=Mangrovihabitans endophyticus TaxID=1751298 RepID=A0A8J3FPJ1_9ACTN|nr:hypothetical protein GCM10012284_32450 [Mangrovihabitans endophyticus]